MLITMDRALSARRGSTVIRKLGPQTASEVATMGAIVRLAFVSNESRSLCRFLRRGRAWRQATPNRHSAPALAWREIRQAAILG